MTSRRANLQDDNSAAFFPLVPCSFVVRLLTGNGERREQQIVKVLNCARLHTLRRRLASHLIRL